jgi:IS30 family transposase
MLFCLGRHRLSSNSSELSRNSQPHEMMRGYLGVFAHEQAKERKKQAGKRLG